MNQACRRDARCARCCPRGLAWIAASLLLWALAAPVFAAGPAAPEFTQTEAENWLNSEPLRIRDLRGQVILVEFWTFACVNCQRSVPWMRAVTERFANQPITLVGVHTPEFAFERPRDKVLAQLTELGIEHAVMLDNDYRYWNAMGNRFWPAFYLIDKQGRVRSMFAGELQIGTPRAGLVEMSIEKLLREAP